MKRRSQERSGSALREDIAWGVDHDIFRDPVGRAALETFRYGAADAEMIEILLSRVLRARARIEEGEGSPFRPPRLPERGLVLGESTSGRPVAIEPAWLNAGVLLVGNTGAGKTSLIRHLILQVALLFRGLFLAEQYKADLRHLRALLAPRGVELVVLRARDLRLNPLQAEGDPRGHLSMTVDRLGRELALPPRAMSIVRATATALYREFGVYGGSSTHWPNLFDVYERVKATTGLNAAAREAILDRLGAFLVSLTPQVGALRLGWTTRDLANHRIVFELRDASEHVKGVVLGHLLFSVFHDRLSNGASNASLDLCVAFEDCQRLFSSGGSSGGDITPIEEIAGLIRGTGVSLWGGCQSPEGLPNGLRANLATKIVGRLGSGADYACQAADIGMTQEQVRWARLNLRPGLFIVQLSEGPWRRPFVVKVPKLTVPPVVDDSEATRSVGALAPLPVIRATEYDRWEPRQLIEVSSSPVREPQGPHLGEGELRLLQAVLAHPGQASSAYAKLASMGSKRTVVLRRTLVELEYLREHLVARSGRGRPSIVLEVTESGRLAVEQSMVGGVGAAS